MYTKLSSSVSVERSVLPLVVDVDAPGILLISTVLNSEVWAVGLELSSSEEEESTEVLPIAGAVFAS